MTPEEVGKTFDTKKGGGIKAHSGFISGVNVCSVIKQAQFFYLPSYETQ